MRTLYGETQRTIAFAFLLLVGLLVVGAWTLGGASWNGVCMLSALHEGPCPDCGLTGGLLFAFAGEFDAARHAHAGALGTAAVLALQPPLRFLLARWRLRGSAGFVAGALDLVTTFLAFSCVR